MLHQGVQFMLWNHCFGLSGFSVMTIYVVLFREFLNKSNSEVMAAHRLCPYLCLQPEDGVAEVRQLLVFAFFVTLHVFQLPLCQPQLLSQSLSVLRLLVQIFLKTKNMHKVQLLCKRENVSLTGLNVQ